MKICFVDTFVPHLTFNVSRLVAGELSKLADELIYVVDESSLKLAIDESKIEPFDICFSTDQYCMSDALKVNADKHVVHIPDVPGWLLDDLENVQIRKEWGEIFEILPQFNAVVVHNKLTPKHLLKYSSILLSKTLKFEHVLYSIDTISADAVPRQDEMYQICMASVFSPHKHQELLIEAVGLLTNGIDINGDHVKLEGGSIPRIVLVGVGLSEDKRDDLQGRADHYGIPLDIHIGITQLHKFELIKQSMFGVYTQKSEYISGLFPIECFYCYKKCICFDYKINQSQFEHHATYASPDDLRQLAFKIFNLINNPEKRGEGTKKANKYVGFSRTPAKHAENLYILFIKICG
ncbi:MAG: glycosyltransferase [Candidatus Omnitrophica bacterium]|nr:glycosyltransferase [Candidatus Omnitrophota bacterium]